MPAIKISKIKHNVVCSDEVYDWFQSNLNVWLPINGITWYEDGSISYITVKHEGDSLVETVFIHNHEADIKYELQGITVDVPVPVEMRCNKCGKLRTVEMTEQDRYHLEQSTVAQGMYVCPDCWEDLT